MTSLAGYRRSLMVLMAVALAATGVALIQALALRGPVDPAAFVLLGLGIGAALAWRGRLWRPMLLLTLAGAAGTIAYLGMVSWWVAVPAGLGVLAYAFLTPAMFRRDRLAAVVATLLSVGFGVQGAALAAEAIALSPPAAIASAGVISAGATVDLPEVRRPERSDDYRRGVDDAKRDIARGRLRLLVYGYPSGSRVPYREILAKNGIELDAVAGCVVSTSLVDHARGYNDVMQGHIAEVFGPRYLQHARNAAEAIYDAKYD
jgi:hypothetical protein